MEGVGVRPQPRSIRQMRRPPGRHELPELRPVAEDAEMGELVDDDGLEGVRWGEDEAPREHQAPVLRGAPPPCPRVAKSELADGDAEGGAMGGDGSIDRHSCALAEPGLEDPRDGSPVAWSDPDHELVATVGPDPLDRRATSGRWCRRDAYPMELAAVVDQATIGRTPTRRGLGLLAREALEMAPDPALAFPDERLDPVVGLGPASPCRGRHGNLEAAPRINAQSQATGTGRAAQDVPEGATRERDSPLRLLDLRGCRPCHHRRS